MGKSLDPKQLSPISRRLFFRQMAVNAAKVSLAAVAVTSLAGGCATAPSGPSEPGGCYCDYSGQDYSGGSELCGAYCDYFNYADFG